MRSLREIGRNPLFIGSSLRTAMNSAIYQPFLNESRNPLFIGSSLRTMDRPIAFHRAFAVVIPFSSGQVFGRCLRMVSFTMRLRS